MFRTNNGMKSMRFKLWKSAAAVVAGAAIASAAMAETPPQVGTSLDSSHVFLNFSSGKSTTENPTTANNYMNAIDPGRKKVNFVSWLVNAGFISKASDWKPSGQQIYTNVPGDYGPGKVNAFAHIIILNSADLGFIRNQYIRCVPDCKTPNAKVYTYLENYGAQQFDSNGVSHTNDSNAVSIALEKRPVDLSDGGHRIADVAFEWAPASNGSNPTHNFGQIYPFVILPRYQNFTCNGSPDTTVEPNGSINGEILGGTFSNPVIDPVSGNQIIDEQYIWPVGYIDSSLPANQQANQKFYDCHFNASITGVQGGRFTPIPALSGQAPDATHIFFRNPSPDYKVNAGDIFAAELDALGTKQTPGVCLICHGGNVPGTLATTQSWGATGEISEFKFLPADDINSIFGANDTGGPLIPFQADGTTPTVGADMSTAGQAAEARKYNQAVAITHGAVPAKTATFASDGSITGQWNVGKSPDHALQVIFGWYQGFDGDYSMSGGTFQQGHFVPKGWRTGPVDPVTGLPGNQLYTEVIQRDCRSCHLNREPSLDFRTQAQFDSNKGNVQDYVFQPECDAALNQINPRNITMPLARLTWERLWNGINADNTTKFGLANTDSTDINLLKAHFGYTPTSYCANQH
jgi:hypothetical protein